MEKQKIWLYLAWATALMATLGSLYFSEIAKFPPCVLCWYQRICLYPIALLIPIGLLKKDHNIPYFVLPLSLIGLMISTFHNLLYYKVLPESAAPCMAGVSCTTKFIEWFGFITIPFLSLTALTIITVCMMMAMAKSKTK